MVLGLKGMSRPSDKVESILAAASVIQDSDDRGRFLDHACAGDDSLRQHMELLLDSHRQTANGVVAPPIQRVELRNVGDLVEAEAVPMAEIVQPTSQIPPKYNSSPAPPASSAEPPVIGPRPKPTATSPRSDAPKSERTSDTTIFVKLMRSRRMKFATGIALIACVLQAIALWVDLRRDGQASDEAASSSISETRPESRDLTITLNDSPNIMNVVTGHDNQGIVTVDGDKSITYGEGIGFSSQGKMISAGSTGPNASRDTLVAIADFHALTAEDGDTISLVKMCLKDLQNRSVDDKRHRKVLFTLLAVEINDEQIPDVRTTVQAYLSDAAAEPRAARKGEPLVNRVSRPSGVSEQSEIALLILEKLGFSSDDAPFLLQAYDYMPKEMEQLLRRTQDPAILDGMATQLGTSESSRVIHLFGVMGLAAEPYAWSGLRHSDPGVREATCRLLSKIGTEKSISHLQPLAKDADASVRTQAEDAIEQIRADGRTPVDASAAKASQD